MKLSTLLLVAAFALVPSVCAQGTPPQESVGSVSGTQARQERRQKMMEMHRQEMAAMKADIETLKSSLAQMKANILTIRDPNELARWKNNVEMWETVVNHMDRMQKQMESMGTGTMHGPGMMMHDEDLRGGQTASPPPDKKPQ